MKSPMQLRNYRAFLPAVLILLYWLVLHLLHGFRTDHLTTGIVILAMYYGGTFMRNRVRPFCMPLLWTAVIYDSMRFYSDYIRGPIHVAEPYNFDKKFFGITTAAGVLTPNEWWQQHTHWLLDLYTGFFYIAFIGIFIAIGLWWYFRYSKDSLEHKSALQMMWSFLWVNLIGFTTYYWYAAAPPWYVSIYGLGPANMEARANPAGCIRFDQILGTNFFGEMYGRSADVFGAIPSLHVAYPLLAVLFAFRLKKLRTFTSIYFLSMCFSAVYLNHHYVLDVMAGWAYAVLTFALVLKYWPGRVEAPQTVLTLSGKEAGA